MKGVVGASMDQRDRETPQSPAPSDPAPPAVESAETVLQLAIDLYGPALLNQPDKLQRQLEEQCPAAASDIALLLSALAEGVPQALMRVSSGEELRRLMPQLEQALLEKRGLNPFGATWAVATWATVLRMDSEGLATSLGSITPVPADGHRDEPRSTSIPTFADVEPSVARPTPAAVELPVAIEVANLPSGPAPLAAIEPQAAIDLPALATVEVPAVVEPQPLVVEATPVVDAPTIVEPIPMVEPATVVASASPVDPVAIVADAEASTASLPAWSKAPVPKRFNPWFGVAGVIVAIVIAFVAMRSVATRSADESQSPLVAAPPVSEPKPVPTAEPVKAPADTPAVAATTTGIVDVTSDNPLVGDGEQHDVFVAIEPQRDDVRWIVVQFIGGDGTWESRPRVVDVSPETLRNGRVRVGTIGIRTTKPASATFQYALTSADGRQGAPFVKRFAFEPVAARPPSLVDVITQGRLVVGRPFSMTIDYRVGDAKLASVERKVFDPRAGTEGAVRVTSVDDLPSPKPGRLRYPFDAVDTASGNTVELTLIDRDGLRSEPRRIVLDFAAPTAATASRTATESPRAGIACTRESCGSVVSVREIDGAAPAPRGAGTSEVIVRMDDRSIRPFVVQGIWKVGGRVRMSGARIVAVNEGGRAPLAKTRVLPPGRLLPESAPIVEP